MAEQHLISLGRVGQFRNRFFGDDQDMGRRLWINIPERQTQIIFVDDVGRDTARDDFREYRFPGPRF